MRRCDPPTHLLFNHVFLKIKKEKVVGSMHPTVRLVFHQFSSNRSSMKRFKGPVTTLLSLISAASFLPQLLPPIVTTIHTHKHTHSD